MNSNCIVSFVKIVTVVTHDFLSLFDHPACSVSAAAVCKTIFQYISNKMQRYTVYFIWKLLYTFRVVLPPIIRSANNCIYSIWYLSHHYCYLPLIAAGSSNGVTNTRCCRYSCLRSWWWVEVPPETCRAVSRWSNCVTLHLVGYILEYSYNAWTHER